MRKTAIVTVAAGIVVAMVVVLKSIHPLVLPSKELSNPVTAPPDRNTQPFCRQLSNTFLVIGHRGNSSEAPENTLAAINQAFAIGAGMVEVDVHLSRDGVPVVIHDETVDRTTNGKGMVSQMTVAQLKALDAGSWKDLKYADERILTLAEALRAAKGKGRLLLDLQIDGMGRAIADVIHSLNLPNSSVAIAAWSLEQTNDIVTHLPRACVLYTFEAPSNWKSDFFKKQLARGITGFDVGGNWSSEFVAGAHAHGMPVYANTINDEPTMRKLIDMGIDGIETDVPAVLVRLINEISGQNRNRSGAQAGLHS